MEGLIDRKKKPKQNPTHSNYWVNWNMLAVILFVWLIGFLQFLSWKHGKYLVLSAFKNPVATFILLSRQSNLSFKTICHKHLLNLYMNDVQAKKRNEAEKERKKSNQFLDQSVVELISLCMHYFCTGSPCYNCFGRELRNGEMLLLRKINWQYHIYN